MLELPHEVVLTSTHNLCFKQKYKKISEFLSENFQFLVLFLVVKFSIYLNRPVFVLVCPFICPSEPTNEHMLGRHELGTCHIFH